MSRSGPRAGADPLAEPNSGRPLRASTARRTSSRSTTSAEQDAIHGLVRWAAWTVRDRAEDRVVMEHVLHPRPGYPFSLALSVEYRLSDDGPPRAHDRHQRRRRVRAPTDAATTPTSRPGHQRGLADAARAGRDVLRSDERGIPVGSASVEGTDYDFRRPRTIGATVLDHAFTDLERDQRRPRSDRAARPRRRRRAHALGRRDTSVRDGVHGRPAPRRQPAQPRGRADDVSAERVPQRRGPDSARSPANRSRAAGASIPGRVSPR